jgi:hypothetical protein
MFDDGAHGDGSAGDGVFGAQTAGFLAGTKVRYYVEARSANLARTANFAPARAEWDTYSYRVTTASGRFSPVLINELMADNTSTLADPQGQFDDWIELHNVSAQDVDLAGMHLSDNPDNPRKWSFPGGTRLPAGGYMLVWMDEDGRDAPGLHASFKLGSGGETLFLVDTDANSNALLDSVTFGEQQPNLTYGRVNSSSSNWAIMNPTPGASND